MSALQHDALVFVHRAHERWTVEGCKRPLFICAEMFLSLQGIEQRRWQMWQLRKLLNSEGHAVATLADFMRAEDVAWLEQCGGLVAHGWYLKNGADQTSYRGLSLGRCLEYDVKARAIRLLKLWSCIARALRAHAACPVYTDYSEESTEFRALQALSGSVRRFGEPDATATARDCPPARQPPALRARLLARARIWGLAALRALSAIMSIARTSATPTVVVRLGLQSARMLQSSLDSRDAPIRFTLWMDYLMRPRTVLSLVLRGAGFTPRPSTGAAADVHDVRALQAAIAQPPCRVELPPASFDIGPVKALHDLLSNMLAAMARARFARSAADIDDALAALGPPGTSLLVIPNDCQPVMRAWTLAAAQLGKRTLVLQHGHLDYTEDGDHLTAEYSAFWSDVVAQDFIRAGLRPYQCLVTGSPNADDYPGRRDRSGVAVAREGRKPRVLLITTGSPAVQAYVDETWVCDYIAGVLGALSPRFAEIELSVKLHPGEDAALYASHLGPMLPAGTSITDRGNLAQMISDADLVISPPSTVVVEARAAGTPVVLVSMMSVDNRQTTLRRAHGVLTVDRYADLPAAVDAMLSGTHRGVQSAWPLSHYLGPIDGRSSQRLLGAVIDLASTTAPSLMDADDVHA